MSTLRLVPASGPPIDVQKDTSLVGREPTCDIVVADGSVSRKHARIERRGDVWYAIDQGSANGTFLDSVRVGESPLRPGQELRFGAVSYRVEIEGGAPDLAATMGPDEAGATVIQRAMPPARPPAPPPPPSPPSPPAVTAEVRLPGRMASPPPPASVTPPGTPVAAPISMPPGARTGRTPAFWIVSGGCGCLLLLALLIVGLIVLPCGGAFTAMWKATEAPVAEIRAQLQDIKAGQLDAAYARFSESYRATVSRSDFEALVEAHPSLKDNADSTFSQRNITNNSAEMSGTLKASSGAVEAVSYQLVIEGGTWKIAALRFAGDASVPPLGSPETGRAPAPGSSLAVDDAGIQKTPVGNKIQVVIALEIRGVGIRDGSGGREWDIAVDLDLLHPNGKSIYSQSPFKELSQPAATEPATVSFSATLTLPDYLDRGRYTARFAVRDKVTGTRIDHDVPFEFP